MGDGDNRHISRDSLFILAELRLGDHGSEYRVKVRNLSSGGMMAEGDVPVTRSDAISVNLRKVGWIDGSVAWVEGNRFGVAFAREIDVAQARMPMQVQPDPQEPFRRRLMAATPTVPAGPLRKVI
ncbi:PilZ domain-containing protein [Novosphingobium piscinae]|uniref:PilZ domain-containing protein n=2 Tax=Novosphingobium piscinae TaxID=1507448 RepID=A0A7X1KQX6_9SPHN|nr:PilZ domain-containing protein [Novosphingobium piscinae]